MVQRRAASFIKLDYGWASSLSRMLRSLYLLKKERKLIYSASNIFQSTQQYNRSTSSILLPAVAAFDKKLHVKQNIFFKKYKRRREEEATQCMTNLVLAMAMICLTSFREL